MNPDDILSQLRDHAANTTRTTKSGCPCCGGPCPQSYRAKAMAARFTELDVSLSYGGILPTEWASPLIPAQRTKRYR